MAVRRRLEDDIGLLVHVAELYYELKLTQQQIADRLQLSRPAISKLLAEAHAAGIVSIEVRHPFSRAAELAQQLLGYYVLQDVVVVPSSRDAELTRMRAAHAGAVYFEERLQDGEVVGIGRGATMYSLVNQLSGKTRMGVKVAPLTGGLGDYDARFQVGEMARVAAAHLGARCYYLHAPASVADLATKQALMSDSQVRPIFELWDHLGWALVGIGAIGQSSTPAYAQRVRRARESSGCEPVADLCYRLLDHRGEEIPEPDFHVLSVELAQLRRARHLLAVAAGASKARAIAACMTGRFIDILITDEFAAESVLSLCRNAYGQ